MTVTVYTQPSCMPCKMTKKHLERRGIPYSEEPINDDVREQAKNAGIMAAPIVLVEGKALWGGYRPDEIDRLAG